MTRLLLIFVLLRAGCSAQTYNVVLNEAAGNYPSSRIGVGLYGPNYYNSLYMQNLLAANDPSFGATQWSATEIVATGSTTGFTSNNIYDGMPANYAAGFTFYVACHPMGSGSSVSCTGGAYGETGTISSNTASVPGTNAPAFTFSSAGATAPVAGDLIFIKSDAASLNTGWTTGGTATYASDTTPADLPPAAVAGLPQPSRCLQVTNASGQYGYIESYLDTVSGQLNYLFNGSYTQSIQAALQSGSLQITFETIRNGYIINSTSNPQTITSGWHTYSATGTGTETVGTTTPQAVAVIFNVTGTGSACFFGASLTENNHTNPSPWRDAVIAQMRQMDIGSLRFNYLFNSAGSSLINLLQPVAYRASSGYQQYGSASYTVNPGTPMGLDDLLKGAQAGGATSVEYAFPNTWTAAQLSNFADYLGGGSGTAYGAIRIALGQTAPWTSVFTGGINLTRGNELWNASTQGVYEGGYPYNLTIPLTIAACASLKSSPSWNASVEKCGVTVQQGYVANNYALVHGADTGSKIDYLDSSNYYGGSTTCTQPRISEDLYTYAWAQANDPGTIGGIYGAQGFPIVTYEAANGDTSGSCTTTGIVGYPGGEGPDMVDPLLVDYLQQAYSGVFMNYNMWELNGLNRAYSSSAGSNPATTIVGWGEFNGVGGEYVNARSTVYAIGARNAAAALGTGYSASVTSPPTWSPSASNENPAYTNVPLLKVFAFKSGTSRGIVIYNTDSVSHTVTFSGSNPPSGTVTQTLYTASSITANNEALNTAPQVTNSTSTLTNPASFTVPANSMAVEQYTAGVSTSVYTVL